MSPLLFLRRTILGTVASAWIASAASAGVTGYYRHPTIHNDQVVFNCEGDLWSASTNGGVANRLTSHPANEQWPNFSPDGKWLAFTADYQGNSDVYIMPSDGGEPKRLTFHPSREDVVGWTPDGKSVMFRARRTGNDTLEQLFTINVAGGEPKLTPIGRAGLGSFSSDGKKIAFLRHTWFANWRRYKGGTAPQIWVGDLDSGKFAQVTKGESVHNYPMWIGDRVHYVTERDGNLNIFSAKPDGSDEKQLTTHADYDVRFADTDGKSIVYVVGADIWKLNLADGTTEKLGIQISSDRIRARPRAEDAGKTVDRFDLNEDGKHVAISSRGEIWIAPTKPGGRIVGLTNSSGIRERQVSFSPDGKKVVCITDETGEQELKVLDVANKAPAKLLTSAGKGWLFPPTWSPDGKHVAYADLSCTLFVVNAETGESKKVDQNDVWEIRDYSWSPDGKWLAYMKDEVNRSQSIMVYNIETGDRGTVSNGYTGDYSPTWDPKGKYLIFASNRFWNPVLDDVDREFVTIKSARLCMAILARDGKSPFLPEEMLDEPKDGEEKSEAKSSDENAEAPTTAPSESGGDDDKKEDADPSDKKDKKAKKKLPVVKIDLEGLSDRVIEVPGAKPGNLAGVTAVKGKIFYIDIPTRGMNEPEDDHPAAGPRQRGGALYSYNIKDKKSEVFLPNVSDYSISGDGKKIAWRDEDVIKVAGTDAKPADDLKEKVSLSSLPLIVDTAAEWAQIFTEAWRLQRDFYWAENMVGVPWSAMQEKYKPLVARTGSRGEINDLVGQLIGELGTSHTYVFGGDANFQPPKPVMIGMLGADIDVDEATGLHRFVRVIRPEKWETFVVSPLSQTHAGVKDGDFLLAINGRELAANDSVDERLAGLAGVEVQLTVAGKADKSAARDIQIKTLSNDFDLRYADLMRRNREYVAERSSGRIGYFHIPDMSGEGLVQFVKGFYPQINKQALVVDVRNNHGGFVSQMILERLNRKVMAYDKPRRGIVSTYPDKVHIGPKACLIDEHSGSDGDIFPFNFRQYGLGKLIGKRSWGGVVGIRSDKGFIDAGMSSQPEFAFFHGTEGWNIEGHGVDPDIEVEFRPEDELAGRDPQLDRAIAELTKQLEANPPKLPDPPPLPVRAGRGGQASGK